MNAQSDDLQSCPSSGIRYEDVGPYEILPYYDHIKKNRGERKNEED
jgi:hypothetical protein